MVAAGHWMFWGLVAIIIEIALAAGMGAFT
jgi:hypothetical protein